ncbi:MAG TPA: hypothetical protein V6D17_16865 [Candidatus Obscuribacterales bacterium]
MFLRSGAAVMEDGVITICLDPPYLCYRSDKDGMIRSRHCTLSDVMLILQELGSEGVNMSDCSIRIHGQFKLETLVKLKLIREKRAASKRYTDLKFAH